MFTQSDLMTLIDAAPPLAVSIFLPTHVRGAETRQNPIRFKNLVREARDKLIAAHLPLDSADKLLAPALELIEDFVFWQHQDQGLAVFLTGDDWLCYKAPIPLAERVVVGSKFHVKPLLPMLTANSAFRVLTVTADRVRFYTASRFSITETALDGIPNSIEEIKGDPDYQSPVNAAPVARPHTASINISNAQIYGDSPEEWRKSRLVEFVRRVSSAVESRLRSDTAPVVLVADSEIGGHFQKLNSFGPRLAGVVELNPAALDETTLLETAYGIVHQRLDAERTAVLERFAGLLGSGDSRATASINGVVRAAYRGRIASLMLAEGQSVKGRYDEKADEIVLEEESGEAGQDLLDAIAAQTLRHGGSVYLIPPDEALGREHAAAVLRY